MHQSETQSPLVMMTKMKRRLREHLAACSELEAFQQLRWQPPPPGTFKVNFDAAIRGSTAFLGAVCRPPEGTPFQAWSDYALTSNTLLAEIRACLFACHMVHHLYLRHVIFEGDSLLCCRSILERDFLTEGPLLGYFERIRELLQSHPDWMIQWAPRRLNQMAYRLAGWMACNFRFGSIAPLSLPSFIYLAKYVEPP